MFLVHTSRSSIFTGSSRTRTPVGTTRFLSNDTLRNGQPSALALDIIKFMDALKIEKAVIGGFDWGARTANIIAALRPERIKAQVKEAPQAFAKAMIDVEGF